MNDLNDIILILQEIKVTKNLSKNDLELIDKAIELAQSRKRKDFKKSILLSIKFIYDYFVD